MTMRVTWLSRLGQDDHSGTCKKLIGPRFMAWMIRAVVFVVWDSLTTVTVGPVPKNDDQKNVGGLTMSGCRGCCDCRSDEWSNTKRDKTAKRNVKVVALIPC